MQPERWVQKDYHYYNDYRPRLKDSMTIRYKDDSIQAWIRDKRDNSIQGLT